MPKPHEQDLLYVRNVAVGINKVISDTVKRVVTVYDEQGKDLYGNYEDVDDSWDTAKGFRFKWGGRSYVIKQGEKKVMPRFLAEQFAGKLVDFMMIERHPTKMSDPVLRRTYREKIILGVYSFFEADYQDEADKVAEHVENINRKVANEVDMGLYDEDHAMGGIPEESDSEILDLPPADPPAKKPKAAVPRLSDKENPPSVDELRAEVEAMGEAVTGNETQEELISKLKAFA